MASLKLFFESLPSSSLSLLRFRLLRQPKNVAPLEVENDDNEVEVGRENEKAVGRDRDRDCLLEAVPSNVNEVKSLAAERGEMGGTEVGAEIDVKEGEEHA